MKESNNNKDKKQDIKKEIIFYYTNSEDKKKAIEHLCEKYDFSLRWLYQILKENNIATPSKFKNDIDSDDNKPNIILKSFDDLETDSDDPIIQKFKRHGFYEEDKAQRAMNIQFYAEERTGIDVWEGYWNYLVQLIYDIESNQLQSDIKEIKAGHFKKLKTVDTIMDQIAISSAEEIQDTLKSKLAEPSKLKPEAQEDKWGELLRFTNPRMYLVYRFISDPQVKEGFINAFNQYQHFSKSFKSKKLNLKNKNLKQREVKNIKPKEEKEGLSQEELKKALKKAIISSMPEPITKKRKGKIK